MKTTPHPNLRVRHAPSATSCSRRAGVMSTRTMWVLVTSALTVAVTGYFVGLRETRKSQGDPHLLPVSRKEPEKTDGHAKLAVKYADLPWTRLGPNRDWRVSLDKLAQPDLPPATKKPPTAAQREEARNGRSERRAFEGAPPVIPHPTLQHSAASCLACHEKGMVVGQKIATKMSHPPYVNCTQCHVEVGRDALSECVKSPVRSERAFEGAPPALPHPVWMRENCLTCHGPTGLAGLRTTHPERSNCLQCHAPSLPHDSPPRTITSTKETP